MMLLLVDSALLLLPIALLPLLMCVYTLFRILLIPLQAAKTAAEIACDCLAITVDVTSCATTSATNYVGGKTPTEYAADGLYGPVCDCFKAAKDSNTACAIEANVAVIIPCLFICLFIRAFS